MSELARRLGYYGSKERWEKWFRGVYEKAGQMYCGSNSAKVRLDRDHCRADINTPHWHNIYKVRADYPYFNKEIIPTLNLEHFPLPLTWIDWESYELCTIETKLK